MKNSLPQRTKRAVDLATKKGASSWLTVFPIKDMDFNLNKREFRDGQSGSDMIGKSRTLPPFAFVVTNSLLTTTRWFADVAASSFSATTSFVTSNGDVKTGLQRC